MEMKIADPAGKWFMNQGHHGFTDPESGTYFPPSVAVKATATDWLASQPVFKELDDPTAPAPEPAPAPTPAPEPAPAPTPAPDEGAGKKA